MLDPKRIEYILEWNLLEKKCKTAIFALYNDDFPL